MTWEARRLVAPAYLLLCLLLGGSSQGPFRNMALQLVGLAILAWATSEKVAVAPSRPVRHLMLLTAVGIAWAVIQLVPMPPSIWSGLGPRAGIADAFQIMGMDLPWLPLSISPYDSLATLLTLIPPLALYVAIERLRAFRGAYLVAALAAGTVLGIVLGVLQAGVGSTGASPFYLYPDVNVGAATGFFANANHMAALLIATLPFLVALAAGARLSGKQRGAAVAVGAIATLLLVVVGIALNGSLAAYLLLPPVLAASALIYWPVRGKARRVAIAFAGVALLAGAGGLAASQIGGRASGSHSGDPIDSRVYLNRLTAEAAVAYLPFGSGLGTYRPAFQAEENPHQVGRTRSVHAHNDFLELALELGLPGIALLLAFLWWWARASFEAWRSPEPQPYVRAAVIVSAALLAHSLVDFPLRTAAMSSIFAMCLAFLSGSASKDPAASGELRPTRHLSLQ